MFLRSVLPLGFCVAISAPLLAQSTAADVMKDMIGYVKMPAPLNPTCNYHVVNVSVSIADKGLSYSAASKLLTGSATQVVAGSRVQYNTLVTTKYPLAMREFSAGNITPVDRRADVSFGWAGDKSATLGTITLNLTKDQKKVYTIPSTMKMTTIATGNKYLLSGTLTDGAVVSIYLEKSAFSDCK